MKGMKKGTRNGVTRRKTRIKPLAEINLGVGRAELAI